MQPLKNCQYQIQNAHPLLRTFLHFHDAIRKLIMHLNSPLLRIKRCEALNSRNYGLPCMSELQFCPYCNASEHKILQIGSHYFCKECEKFFSCNQLKIECPKCEKKTVTISDFPMPDGSLVFQCMSCKKMFSLKEIVEQNSSLSSKKIGR